MVVQVWTPTPLGSPATQRTREPKSHPRATFKRRLRERACCHLFGVAWKWKTLSCCCNTEKRKMMPANKRKREHRKFPSCFMWRGGGFISQEVKSSSTAAGSVLGNSSCCGALGTGIAFGRRTPFAAKSISARVTSGILDCQLSHVTKKFEINSNDCQTHLVWFFHLAGTTQFVGFSYSLLCIFQIFQAYDFFQNETRNCSIIIMCFFFFLVICIWLYATLQRCPLHFDCW